MLPRLGFQFPHISFLLPVHRHCDVLSGTACPQASDHYPGQLCVLWLVESLVHAVDVGVHGVGLPLRHCDFEGGCLAGSTKGGAVGIGSGKSVTARVFQILRIRCG